MESCKNLKLGIPREQLYARLIDELAEGVLLIDLDSMAIEDANPAIARMLGYTTSELTALRIYDIVAHARSDVENTARLTLANGQHLIPRRRMRRRDGTILQVEVTVNRVDLAGRRAAFAIVRDLAEKIALEHRLQNMQLYDAMTGLPTSNALRDHAEHLIQLCARDNQPFVYIVLDLNKFSAVNERFGPTAGDEVIAHVAHRLTTGLKSFDIVGRLQGGDEFGVLCRVNEGAASARNIADRILTALDDPITLGNGTAVSVTSSLGAALFPDHGANFDELAQHAGVAMKRARTERLPYVLYDPAQARFGNFGFDIAIELPRAINENRLSLLFQPIVETASLDRCVGAEALVRWNHEQAGVIPPGYFVPQAEEANIVHRLDRWVIENVIRQIAVWQQRFPDIWISANISSQTLATGGIVPWVIATLKENGVAPAQLMLELTETAAMMNRNSVIAVLEDLRAAGVRIALDDFGTGYSSLAYLKHIPVDVVKIDREFVAGIGSDARDEHTVKTIVGLLRGIDCALLAEGVETEDQCEWLKAIGIEMIQGYWIARPTPADRVHEHFDRVRPRFHAADVAMQPASGE